MASTPTSSQDPVDPSRDAAQSDQPPLQSPMPRSEVLDREEPEFASEPDLPISEDDAAEAADAASGAKPADSGRASDPSPEPASTPGTDRPSRG